MIRTLLSLLVAMLAAVGAHADSQIRGDAAITAEVAEIADMGMAREWCDRSMLQAVEGIWEFPADGTTVLIRHSATMPRGYELIVVETPDTRLQPGDLIGTLRESASSSKFELELFRNHERGVLANPGKCLAEYVEADDALVITARKLSISMSPRWLLPSFWKSIRVSMKKPLNQLPKGLIRIYPTPERCKIDYL